MILPTGTYDGSGGRIVCPGCGNDFETCDMETELCTHEDNHSEEIEYFEYCPVCGCMV